MRLVQNQEIVGEQKSALPFHLLLHPAQEHEKQRVIDNYDRRALEFSPGALIKAAVALPTRFLGANVGLAANLRPNLRVWLERQIAQRAVARSRRPDGDFFELVLLRPGEKIVLLLARAQQPARTNIILPAFDQCRIEGLGQNFL